MADKPISGLPAVTPAGPDLLAVVQGGVTSRCTVAQLVALAAGGLTIGTTPVTSGTAGRVLFEGAGNVVSEDAGLSYSATNDTLSIVGGADATRLIVKANATQSNSNPLIVAQKSDSTELFHFNSDDKSNFFAGFEAGINNTITGSGEEGLGNIYIGYQSGKSSASQHTIRNTAVGYGTLTNIQTQNGQNSAFGYDALNAVTTGTKNNAFGVLALFNLTSGASNVGVGVSAGREVTTGTGNVFVGLDTGRGVTTQGKNTIVGDSAATAIAGADNTAIGGTSLFSATSGDENTAVGSLSLFGSTTGANNIAIGYRSGFALTTGSNNILIGYNIDPPSNTANGQLSIGNLIFGTGVDGQTTTVSSGSVGVGVASPVSGARLDVRGHLGLTNAGTASELRLYEPSGGGTNYSAFKAGAQSADLTYTLPAAAAPANGSPILSSTAGVLSYPTGTPDGTKFLRDDGTWAAAVGASFPLLAPDGAFGAPSYAFSGQSGLGFYRITTNTIGLTAGAAGLMQFDASVGQMDIGGAAALRLPADAGVVKFGGSLDTSISRDSAGVIAVGTGAAGSTAGSLKLTNLTATGTVTTNAGTGTGTILSSGTVNVQTSASGVGNGADTNDDTLFTYSLPLNSMSGNGKSVHVEGSGHFATTANTKRVKLWFAGTVIADSGVLTLSNVDWVIDMTVIRIDATHVSCRGNFAGSNVAAVVTVSPNVSVSDLTANASVIKVTGASTITGAANDVLGYFMKTDFYN